MTLDKAMSFVQLKKIGSLTAIQASQAALGVISVPIFVAALGIDGFGVYSFFLALFSIVSVMGMMAVDSVDIHSVAKSENPAEIAEIIVSSFWLRAPACFLILFAGAIGYLFLGELIFSIEILVSLSIFLASLLVNVHWYFIATGRPVFLACLDFLSKVIQVLACFFLVSEPEHAILVFVLSALMVSLVPFMMMPIKQLKPVSKIPELPNYVRNFKVSVSLMFHSGFSQSIPISLMYFSGAESVGIFSLVDKIVMGCKALFLPISKVLTPSITKLVNGSKDQVLIAYLIMAVIIGIFILISCGLTFFQGPILGFLSGKAEVQEISDIFSIYIFIVPLYVANSLMGFNVLLALNATETYSHLISLQAILGISIVVAASLLLSFRGTVTALVVFEAAFMIVTTYFVKIQMRRVNRVEI